MVRDATRSHVGYNRQHRHGHFDWDGFWAFTSKQERFNRLLYWWHFRYYRRLLDGVLPPRPKILELGAGSGSIPQMILRRWGGSATLIDSNRSAKQLFLAGQGPNDAMTYILGDVLDLAFPPLFDLVYSDGLIEHFPDKDAVMQAHIRAMKPNGYLLLFVPNNSLIFRTLTKMGPDFGYEERYTAPALIDLCRSYNLKVLRHTSYFFEVGVLCQKQP